MIDTSGWDWGDVPTWVGAITTLGALIAAGFVVIIELRRDNQATVEAADRRRAAERAEQADSVAAWSEPQEHPGEQPAWAVVLNGSRLPVYDVKVRLSDATTYELIDIPADQRDDHCWSAELGIVPPGQQLVRVARNSTGGQAWRTVAAPLWVAIKFTDTGGRRWYRDEFGDLQPSWEEH